MANNAHRLVLFMGGARSGKSSFADSCGRAFSRVIYFATAHHSMGADGEMDERIAKHLARRPKEWKTMEPPATIDDLLSTALLEKPDNRGVQQSDVVRAACAQHQAIRKFCAQHCLAFGIV